MKDKRLRPLIEKVAVLRGRGMKQNDIADHLGLTQPKVSFLIKEAEKLGILGPPHCSLPKAKQKQISHAIFASELITALREELAPGIANLQGLEGFYSGPSRKRESTRKFAERLEVFARQAAPSIEELIEGSNTTAVTWGWMLRNIVDELHRQIHKPPRKRRPIRFIPACCDAPYIAEFTDRSSSRLVAELNETFNGEVSSHYAVLGVTAIIPLAFMGDEFSIVQRFIEQTPRYGRVFDKKKGLSREADTILTSVGAADRKLDPWLKAVSEAIRGKRGERFERIVLGNIGGVFLNRPDISDADRALVEKVNRHWTGIPMEQYQDCANRASESRGAGVVVVAVGRDKAPVVREALRRGLISHLLIDHQLAAALGDKFPGPNS
ncbi:MAG: hypothetical protein ACYTGZ_06870 [Planctomycetota bacterium]|jgi:DNA-binding transcriptional regulator LsrR (DeoR family)